jgi:hypothetical protein
MLRFNIGNPDGLTASVPRELTFEAAPSFPGHLIDRVTHVLASHLGGDHSEIDDQCLCVAVPIT